MESYPERRGVLSNIACDLDNKSIPHRIASGVIRFAIRKWWTERATAPPDLLISYYASTHRACYCLGRHITPAPHDRLSRVLSAKDMQHNMFTHRFLAEVPRRTIRMWELGISGRLAFGSCSGALGFAWVTKRSDLDSVLHSCSSDTKAKAATDALGLAHKLRGGQLIILDYPPDPPGLDLRKPTFIDGSDNFAFASTNAAAQWGRTRCLSGALSGCSEAVHRPIPFTSMFRIRYLGLLNAYDISIDYGSFRGGNPMPWHRRLRAWLLRQITVRGRNGRQ